MISTRRERGLRETSILHGIDRDGEARYASYSNYPVVCDIAGPECVVYTDLRPEARHDNE